MQVSSVLNVTCAFFTMPLCFTSYPLLYLLSFALPPILCFTSYHLLYLLSFVLPPILCFTSYHLLYLLSFALPPILCFTSYPLLYLLSFALPPIICFTSLHFLLPYLPPPFLSLLSSSASISNWWFVAHLTTIFHQGGILVASQLE